MNETSSSNRPECHRPSQKGPKLLDRLREMMRRQQYAPHQIEASARWVETYIRYHGLRHPRQLGPEHVAAFVNSLRSDGMSRRSGKQPSVRRCDFCEFRDSSRRSLVLNYFRDNSPRFALGKVLPFRVVAFRVMSAGCECYGNGKKNTFLASSASVQQ